LKSSWAITRGMTTFRERGVDPICIQGDKCEHEGEFWLEQSGMGGAHRGTGEAGLGGLPQGPTASGGQGTGAGGGAAAGGRGRAPADNGLLWVPCLLTHRGAAPAPWQMAGPYGILRSSKKGFLTMIDSGEFIVCTTPSGRL